MTLFVTAARNDYLWIDANDNSVEGEWKSSDGSLLTYKGFHHTEPSAGTHENCAVINMDLNYQWSDISCYTPCRFVCEIPSF
jgi:hypothetical protein